MARRRRRPQRAARGVPAVARGARWEDLPSELVVEALHSLPPEAIGAVAQVCRAWRDSLKSCGESVDLCILHASLRRFPYLMDSSSPWSTGPLHNSNIRELYQDEVWQHGIRRRFKMWATRRQLGNHPHGTCYLAHHEETGEMGVLKYRSFRGRDEGEGVPFDVMREISLVKQLASHANVIRLKDQFLLRDCKKVVMCYEYGGGFNLKEFMRSQQYRLSVRQCPRSLARIPAPRLRSVSAARSPRGRSIGSRLGRPSASSP